MPSYACVTNESDQTATARRVRRSCVEVNLTMRVFDGASDDVLDQYASNRDITERATVDTYTVTLDSGVTFHVAVLDEYGTPAVNAGHYSADKTHNAGVRAGKRHAVKKAMRNAVYRLTRP